MASVVVDKASVSTPKKTPKKIVQRAITSIYTYKDNKKSLKVDKENGGGYNTELFNCGPAKVSLLFCKDKDNEHVLLSCLKFLEVTPQYDEAMASIEDFIRQYRAYVS